MQKNVAQVLHNFLAVLLFLRPITYEPNELEGLCFFYIVVLFKLFHMVYGFVGFGCGYWGVLAHGNKKGWFKP